MKTLRQLTTVRLAIIACISIAFAGCTAVRKSEGGAWTYVNVLNKKSITGLELGTNGTLKVKGYTSDASEAIKAAAEGAAKGTLDSVGK